MAELHFVIGEPGPSHESGRFIELENEKGEGAGYGKWKHIGDRWHLVIPDLREPLKQAGRLREVVDSLHDHIVQHPSVRYCDTCREKIQALAPESGEGK